MTLEAYLFIGVVTLCGLLLCIALGNALSGLAYPGAGAPFLPDGPIRALVWGDVAFVAVCGALRLLGA